MARILIIDDDSDIRQMLKQMLNIEGYDVDEATNGNEAIKIFNDKPADLIITDIIMPDKEGIETIREMRNKYSNIKIIAISGGGRAGPTDYLKIAKTFGANRTFTKPFDRKEFLDCVKELLNNSS